MSDEDAHQLYFELTQVQSDLRYRNVEDGSARHFPGLGCSSATRWKDHTANAVHLSGDDQRHDGPTGEPQDLAPC